MLFPLVGEEFPLKKIKANTRPIKTLSSCYHLGTVLNIHIWSWFSLKILFPSSLGITDLTWIQNSYNPLKKGKVGMALTSPEKTHSDFIHSWFQACRNDEGWQGQRLALGALPSSPPPPVLLFALQEGGPQGTCSSVQSGYLQRAELWFILYGTKTTGMLFVYTI